MSSLRKQKSARLNGARSHGPVTLEGKAHSSQNAIRHGFLSGMVVTGSESEEGLKDILNQHLERFGHLDGVEFGMLEEMAVCYWRMRRIWAVEKRWMDDHIAADPSPDGIGQITNAFGALADSHRERVLHRYESRMHRIYQKSLQTLMTLQATNKETAEPEPDDAKSKSYQTNPIPFPDTKV